MRHCLTLPITTFLRISLYVLFFVSSNQMFSIFSSQIKFWLFIHFIWYKNEVCNQAWCADKVCLSNYERNILQAYILAHELHQHKYNSSGMQHIHYVKISKCSCFVTEFVVQYINSLLPDIPDIFTDLSRIFTEGTYSLSLMYKSKYGISFSSQKSVLIFCLQSC
jgi:hypothetical protein